MTISASQSLDQLRGSPEPAWLWDAARGRVVWANAAGVAAFECQSLFDLIDRPFDLREEGVARVSALAARLKTGEQATVELSFPSTGRNAPFQCTARLHPLADGRAGVLIVEGAEAIVAATTEQTEAFAAYDYLPMPVTVIAEDGAILHSNASAAELIAAPANLRNLLAEPARAALLLQRLQTSGLLSSVERINGRHGAREARLTLRRVPDGGPNAHAIVTLEDVTERRLIEKAIPLPAAPSTAAHVQKAAHIRIVPAEDDNVDPMPLPQRAEAKATAFAEIGRQLSATIGEKVNGESAKQKRGNGEKPFHVPQAIRATLEKSPEGLIIVQDGKTHFANARLAETLSAKAEELLGDQTLPQLLAAVEHGAKLSYRGGDFDVAARQVPWMGGPATQYTIARASDAPPQVSPQESPQESKSGYVISFSSKKEQAPPPTPVASPAPAPERKMATVQAARKTAEIIEYPPVPIMPLPRPAADVVTAAEKIGTGHELHDSSIGHFRHNYLRGFLDTLSSSDLRHLVDVAADGAFIIDVEGRVLDVSFGADVMFSNRTRQVQDFLTPESRRILRERLSVFGDEGDGDTRVEGLELLSVTAEGKQLPMFATLCRIGEGAQGIRYGLVLRDISTWRALEEKLEHAHVHATETRQTNTDFLAQVNHELRTPLNAILGFAEVMQQERFGPLGSAQYQSYVKDIRDSGGHLLSIVNDLLELSRIEAGKMELNFTAVDLGEVVDHAMRMLSEEARKGSVTIRKEIQDTIPHVVADLRAMRQIVMNLLSNAVKYTNAGGEAVVAAGLNAQGEMVLSVADTGVGMDKEDVNVALEPFGRIHIAGRDVTGTGLGLPLTQALVKANRAQFHLESEAGKGTRATITFPTTRVLAD